MSTDILHIVRCIRDTDDHIHANVMVFVSLPSRFHDVYRSEFAKYLVLKKDVVYQGTIEQIRIKCRSNAENTYLTVQIRMGLFYYDIHRHKGQPTVIKHGELPF